MIADPIKSPIEGQSVPEFFSNQRPRLFCQLFSGIVLAYTLNMSIRNRGGEWEPLLLGIEPESCGVCGEGLYRNLTMLRGGWSRCSQCDRFVHWSCLASGKVAYFKKRPRICLTCEKKAAGSTNESSVRPSHTAS